MTSGLNFLGLPSLNKGNANGSSTGSPVESVAKPEHVGKDSQAGVTSSPSNPFGNAVKSANPFASKQVPPAPAVSEVESGTDEPTDDLRSGGDGDDSIGDTAGSIEESSNDDPMDRAAGAESGESATGNGGSFNPLSFLGRASPGAGESAGKPSSGLADLNRIAAQLEPEVPSQVKTTFDDMIEATAPHRDLPEDMDEGLKNFVHMIDSVYTMLHDPDMLGGVMRSIMIELQHNPQYDQQVYDCDYHTWVKAMRRGMGLAVARKAESKAKRATSTAKTGGRAKAKSDVANLMRDLGMSADFD